MEQKQKRSNDRDLDLSLQTPSEVEPINKTPTSHEAMNLKFKQGIDHDVDEKKLRRRMSNKLSAQRSRRRMLNHKVELEQKIKVLQDTIASMGPKLENVKNNKKKLQLENEMLQEQLDSITDKSNRLTAQNEELNIELKGLMELAKTQEDQDHMEIKGESSNLYDHDESESAAEMEVDQYLNFDAMNFYPTKNDI